MLKILMISRSTLYVTPGGDTMQILETAKSLRALGLAVDVKLTNELIDYTQYDLLHFFNIIRPDDILPHVKKSQLPYVISPIFVDYGEYEKNNRKGILRIVNKFINADQIEYLKAIVRALKGQEKIKSFYYLFNGQRKSVQLLLKNCSNLLPNSNSEYNRLVTKYGINKPYVTVPNGIDTNKFAATVEQTRDTILCVARIEPLKNQLNVIRAINSTDYKLIIIGKPSLNSSGYYEQCKKEAGANVTFIQHLPQEQLSKYYQSAKVHVLASWFETTGLSSLEAGYMGCNLVITKKGDTTDYFKDNAFYCDPSSVSSIKEAIDQAFNTKSNIKLKEEIERSFTWQQAAKKTLEGYQNSLIYEKQSCHHRVYGGARQIRWI
jgi:glycosyltransferase involved in cell wall biosynthesis